MVEFCGGKLPTKPHISIERGQQGFPGVYQVAAGGMHAKKVPKADLLQIIKSAYDKFNGEQKTVGPMGMIKDFLESIVVDKMPGIR